MRKVVSGLFITLDGVTEAPNEWQFDSFDGDLGAEMGAMIAGTDTVLLGRVTYQEWAGYWPTASDEPFAGFINNTPKYVVSTTLADAKLVQGLTAHGLVDQYRLMTFPIVLGIGKRLFEGGLSKTKLRLVDNTAVGKDGVVILTYEPIRG